MRKHFIQLLVFFILLICTAFVVVVASNIPNISKLLSEPRVIVARDSYELTEIDEGEEIEITGTKNDIFSAEGSRENGTEFYFGLEEYIFDFILFTSIEPTGTETTYTCINVSEKEREPLFELIQRFNEPVQLSADLPGLTEPIELNNPAEETTRGRFGNETRLLDCTDTEERSDFTTYFLIGAEFVVLTAALLYLFRKRFIEFAHMIEHHEY